ncbi:MAG: hypothetical protein ATN35_04805 [Epulopiscium sp. Nele67-Bin004]|nr:MAG: hypothetical protein ATN35_04805 [Epulopiscium sp. Nele67-Bin004]
MTEQAKIGEYFKNLDQLITLQQTKLEKLQNVKIICNQQVKPFENFHGTPSLIVEVLSGNISNDRILKFNKYAKFGVKEYWIIDPKSSSIEQYVLENDKYTLLNAVNLLTKHELNYLTPAERQSHATTITPHLFQDLEINLTDIFEY